jgi:hypothetical protein
MTRMVPIPPWLAAVLGGFTYLLLHLIIELAFPEHWAGSLTRLLGMSYAGWAGCSGCSGCPSPCSCWD